jgi:hypothetical protein
MVTEINYSIQTRGYRGRYCLSYITFIPVSPSSQSYPYNSPLSLAQLEERKTVTEVTNRVQS